MIKKRELYVVVELDEGMETEYDQTPEGREISQREDEGARILYSGYSKSRAEMILAGKQAEKKRAAKLGKACPTCPLNRILDDYGNFTAEDFHPYSREIRKHCPLKGNGIALSPYFQKEKDRFRFFRCNAGEACMSEYSQCLAERSVILLVR